MTDRHSRRFTRLATALLVLSACSTSHAPGVESSPAPAAAPTANQQGPGRYPYTAADVGFMTHMIAHHAQALVMAGWAPSHGASPAVRTLAERIINGQQDEIATMQRWLRDRGQPVPEPNVPSMKMDMDSAVTGSGHDMHHQSPSSGPMLMPGMLNAEQMKELDQARGPEFDRKFLRYMIQHHRGALTMVQNLFGTPGAAQEETTFKLANDISADQSSEITRMQRMLDETGGASPS